MSFRDRLGHVLREISHGPKIVAVRFVPAGTEYAAKATFDDGFMEILFPFNPNSISFSKQELIGLTAKQARALKDDKIDELIGIS